LLDTPVKVAARGGELTIDWQDAGGSSRSVQMTGGASTVFTGEIEI
jgi:diaminopimelate epimerase